MPPSTLSIITTNKCTAECLNCCFGCNRKNKDKISFKEAKEYIDQALNRYDSIKVLVLTGGECFTLGKQLDKTVEYASEKGLIVRVVTNAYWAKTFKTAYKRLIRLSSVGLKEINISTGDEHLEWVKLDNIINAITAGLLLNLTIAINVETSPNSSFTYNKIKDDIRLRKYNINSNNKLHIINGVWMPFKKSSINNNTLSNNNSTNARCTSLFNNLVISPQHYLYACCGLTCQFSSFLYLGNAKKHPLDFLYNKQFEDFMKIWLFTDGPQKILQFALKCQNKEMIDTKGWHICQICAKISQDKENIIALRENYSTEFENTIIKYNILRRQYLSTLNINPK